MSAVLEADVVVVGGGVAGASTARHLAEAGHRVILLDKARFPREKACGEGVMPTGVRLLDQLGVLARIPRSEYHPIKGVRFVIDGRHSVQGDFPDIGAGCRQGLGIRRFVLDQYVLDYARAHPRVEVHEAEEVIDACWPPKGLAEVATPSTRYRARLVIGADGIRSLIRRRLGLGTPRGVRQRFGVRAHFAFADHRPLLDYVTVYRSDWGEAYVTPVNANEVGIALLLDRPQMREFAGQLNGAYDSYVQREVPLRRLLRGGRRINPALACGPFDVGSRSRVADRAMLVGDAGGYLDPITGEGISLALQTARWAAEIADEALRRDNLSRELLEPFNGRVDHALRHHKVLTRAILAVTRHPLLATLMVRYLDRCPRLYAKLLAINCGVQTFWDIEALDFCPALHRSPRR